ALQFPQQNWMSSTVLWITVFVGSAARPLSTHFCSFAGSKRIFSRYFLLQFLQQNLTSSPLTLSAMSSFTGSPEIGHLTTSCLASSFAAAWSPSGAEP